MCGIAGIHDRTRCYDIELLRRMAASIAHRGPDSEGLEHFPEIGTALAHRRLAIIDTSERGHQPMYDANGRYCIVFNGELYNFRELRKELQTKGYRFHSKTDTEVLLCAYAEFGEACLDRFNGEYAFCIVDRQTGVHFLARDPFGVKPLFYYWHNGTLIFASEMKAILQAPFVPSDACPQGIADYLAFGFTKAPGTAFKYIRSLPAGHKMQLRDGTLTVSEYWRWQNNPRYWNEEDATQALNEMLDQSVTRKLVSDVPIGSFLSGGVDSSLVSHYASHHHSELNTFSIGFNDKRKDESGYAKEASTRIGSNHHVFVCDENILDSLYRISWHLDEPFSDFSALPTYFLAKKTREHVTVALSGDGSDELLRGYSYHRWLHLLKQARRWPSVAISLAALALTRLTRHCRESHPLARIARLAKYASLGTQQFIIDRYMKLSDKHIATICKEKPHASPEAALRLDLGNGDDDALTLFDIKYGLEQDMLVKVDRMAMANSLEVRIPFLDMELAALIQSLPNQLKVHKGETKYLLKKVAATHLGRNIVYRKKMGFSAPIDNWLGGSFGEIVNRHIFSNESQLGSVLDKAELLRLLAESGKRRTEMSPLLYQLVSLDIWLRNVSSNRMKEALVG